jgi:hypothetical protein
MTSTSDAARRGTRSRSETPSHFYKIGQSVRFVTPFRTSATSISEVYEVTATLPARDASPQYRIRALNELHERVTTEVNLEPIRAKVTETSLLEATFGPR